MNFFVKKVLGAQTIQVEIIKREIANANYIYSYPRKWVETVGRAIGRVDVLIFLFRIQLLKIQGKKEVSCVECLMHSRAVSQPATCCIEGKNRGVNRRYGRRLRSTNRFLKCDIWEKRGLLILEHM